MSVFILSLILSDVKDKSLVLSDFCYLNKKVVFKLVNYDKLGAIAKEKGLSQSFISTKIGMSRNYIKDCKRQNIAIPTDRLIQIADILNTTVDYLTDQTDEKEKTAVKYSGKTLEFIELFQKLSPEKQEMLINMIKGLHTEQ